MSSVLLSGLVIDGLGNSPFQGHVLIEGERIKDVLQDSIALPKADKIIDASDCAIAPGFIDMHSHLDWILPHHDHPKLAKRLLEQGITTVIGGNCGVSPAPIRSEKVKLLDALAIVKALVNEPVDYEWLSMAQFLERIEGIKPVVNLAQLVGHSTIRIAAANTRRGKMEPDEMKECLHMVRQSLEEGACGLSFGLGYDPGIYSPTNEIEAFCRIAEKAKKPVTVHLRSYSKVSPAYPIPYSKPYKFISGFKPHNLRALDEMIDVARHTGIKLQISHFHLGFHKAWPLVDECLRMINNAHSDGVNIMIDAFPYTCANTTIDAPFSSWFLAKLPNGYHSWWARARLRAENMIGYPLAGFSYDDCQLMDASVEGWKELNGLTIVEIARRWNTAPLEAILRLSESSRSAALMLFHGISGGPDNERALESVLSHDSCLFETDVILRNNGYPNPAGFGTFPKILGYYVRKRNLFSIENAVRRMTSASADRFGIRDRGRLEPGKAADIVIFDSKTISETPPIGKTPAGKPTGIKHVFLNGVHVVDNGSYVPETRAGRVLRL